MKKLQIVFVGLIASMAIGPVSQASVIDGVVDTWLVEFSTVYDADSVQWQLGEPDGTVVDDKTLQWGSGASGPSTLVIGPDSSANVDTNGALVPNIAVTHTNNPIGGNSGELDSVVVNSTLTLTPVVPGGGSSLELGTLSFTVLFDETSNGPATCVDGTANGTGLNENGCADVFVIDQDALNFQFSYDLGEGLVDYFISFVEITDALTPLSPEACAATGADEPCVGFLTPEQAATTALFAAVITTGPLGPSTVPAPGVLLLTVSGLLGLHALRRTRRRSQQRFR